MLAVGAPVGAAAAKLVAADRGVAAAAGFAPPPIHPGHSSVVAVGAAEVAEVAED